MPVNQEDQVDFHCKEEVKVSAKLLSKDLCFIDATS
jgi:hypothetical protein